MHCILPNGLESNFKECSRIFRIISTVNFKFVCSAGVKRYKTGKVDAQLCRKLETVLLSQKSCESWTWTPSRDLRVPLCCKGGCLQPRVASWQHTVQPMPSDCGVVLLEAPKEGESGCLASDHGTENCLVLSVMGKSPFMVVPKAFSCNVLSRNYSSLLRVHPGAQPPCIQWEGQVSQFLILMQPRQKPGTNSSVCTPCSV